MVDIEENSPEMEGQGPVDNQGAIADVNMQEGEAPQESQQVSDKKTEIMASAKPDPIGGFLDKIKGMINPSQGAPAAVKPKYPKAAQKIKPPTPPAASMDVQTEADVAVAELEAAENINTEYKGEPLMTVIMRNRFYRDGYRNLIKIAIAEAVIIVLLIVAFAAYMSATKPEDRYFATTADGRIMKMVPLSRSNMSTSALMSWVAQSSTEIMTFGFHDYQTRLQKSSRHFTRRGWEGFTKALQRSKIIEAVSASSQVVTAKPRSAPVLVQEGVFNGKYRWVVDLPLQVNYQSSKKSRVDNLMVRMVIDRVTSLENPYGVGIEQWIAKAN